MFRANVRAMVVYNIKVYLTNLYFFSAYYIIFNIYLNYYFACVLTARTSNIKIKWFSKLGFPKTYHSFGAGIVYFNYLHESQTN